MEQYKIIYEIVATGFISALVYYFVYQPKYEREKDMKSIEIIGNTAYKSLFAASIILAFITLIFGLTGYLEKMETINAVATLLIESLIFLVFSFSFSPPKIMNKLFSK
jgi:hypothetical protein